MDQARQAAKPDDPRVKAALAEYMERVDRGEQVDREQFLAAHADIADELGSFITTSEELARLASPARQESEAQSISTRSLAERDQETLIPQRVQGAQSDPDASSVRVTDRLPEQFGRYKILKPLGSGAMGTVYLAEDSQLHRKVALKTPSFEQDETGELLERFYREARSAATIRHPHICPVFDVGEIGGKHFITMAWIEGRPLSAYIRPDKLQPERQTLVAVRKLALALQEAHDHNIIHRDLKPGNIMIDGKGEPIVMDFGLARKVHREDASRLTQSGMIVGSPAYMSPEQVEGDPDKLGPAADQYSLGVILYELLTGQLPFRGSVTGVIGAILTKEPTPVTELRPGIDPRIAALCARMMKKSASERFPSMKAVAETIAGILKEAPGEAMKETVRTVERATKPQAGAKVEKGAEAAAAVSITASNVTSLYEAAQKCMRKHDYEQVVQMLQQIPEQKRTDEVRALLTKARQLADEVAFLLAEIDEAERVNDNAVLTRATDELLKLKPKHHKALQIKDELSRYGTGKLWKPGGYTPDGRRIGEGSWIPWLGIAVGVIAFAATLWAVTIYLRSGSAVVRVQINDPDIKFTLQGQTITIDDNGKELKISPEDENTLSISYGDATFTSDQFTLNKGDNPAVVVEVLDKTLAAKFGELSIGEWPVETPAVAGTSPVEPVSGDSVPPPATTPTASSSPVPGDAVAFQGHSYKYFGEKLTWKEAKQRCEQLGGHLPIVETGGENAFLNDLADKGFPNAGRNGFESVWLGATDEVKEGEWRWIDGSRVAYTNWLANQPNNKQNQEHYALLWLSRDPNRVSGQWSDQPNDSVQHIAHFICEWDELRNTQPVQAQVAWTDLFNGTDLTGWHTVGDGGWTVQGGVLTGAPGDGWIATDRDFTDFELQLDFRLSPRANSGVFLRIPDQGALSGADFMEVQLIDETIQANVETWQRTGAIYAVQGPTPPSNPAVGQWHQLTIRADGPEITVSIDGTEVNRVNVDTAPVVGPAKRDLQRPGGHIGFQHRGQPVEFRNIRIRELSAATPAAAPAAENAGGWTDLFNGRDLTGWRGLPGQWRWENGEVIGVTTGAANFNTVLCSNKSYRDFEAEFEIKLDGDTGNSGLQIRSRITDEGNLIATGPQVDVGGEFWGSLYGELSGGMMQQSDRAAVQRALRPGEYNRVAVRCVGKHVRITLNGEQLVDGDFATMPNEGILGWQLHRGKPMTVRIRNARIREVNGAGVVTTPATAQPLPRNEWIPLDPSAPRATSWNWGKPLKNPENKKWENGVLSLDNAAVAFNQVQAKDVSFRAKVRFLEGNNMALVVRGEHGKGGLYALFDKQASGQMYVAFLNTNKSKTLALKDDYFDFQVDAIGDQVSIQVNGQTVVRHRETEKLKAGHIEVTAYNARGMFKEMAVKILDAAPAAASAPAAAPNGWTDLFSGRDLAGWQSMETLGGGGDQHRPTTGGWEARNGELLCTTDQPGWLKSAAQYGDFELETEFKLPAGGNSDIYIRCPGSGRLSRSGMAIQIIDEHSGKFTMDPTNRPGAIWGVVGHEIAAVTRPLGEWNSLSIRCEGDRVQVSINGQQTVDTNMQAVAELRDRPRSGFIGIANWGGEAKGIAFRNMRIRTLP